jgi:DNA-binding NarL/FixJ family response regulator
MEMATPPPYANGALTGATRVLVVDDQPVFRDAARQLLERRGYTVVAEAGCAASALDAVERFTPEAQVSDGLSALTEVVRDVRVHDFPVAPAPMSTSRDVAAARKAPRCLSRHRCSPPGR